MVPVDVAVCLRAADLRAAIGLLTNDSIALAVMRSGRITAIATADSDFEAIEDVVTFRPTDLMGPLA